MIFKIGDRVKVKNKIPCRDCSGNLCQGLQGTVTNIAQGASFPISIRFDKPTPTDNCSLKEMWIELINTKELF